MRTIKFRGIAIFGKVFIYGSLIIATNEAGRVEYFIKRTSGSIQVKEESVGQFTGLKDKNSVEIYEGDIVESMLPRNKFFDDIAKVVFRKGSFMMKSVEFEDETSCLIDSEQFIEVIGNIYMNKELLCQSNQ